MQKQRSLKQVTTNGSLVSIIAELQLNLDQVPKYLFLTLQGRISDFIKSFLQLIDILPIKYPKDQHDRFIKKDLIQLAVRASSSCFIMSKI